MGVAEGPPEPSWADRADGIGWRDGRRGTSYVCTYVQTTPDGKGCGRPVARGAHSGAGERHRDTDQLPVGRGLVQPVSRGVLGGLAPNGAPRPGKREPLPQLVGGAPPAVGDLQRLVRLP